MKEMSDQVGDEDESFPPGEIFRSRRTRFLSLLLIDLILKETLRLNLIYSPPSPITFDTE